MLNFKNARANCFGASLLRMQIHTPGHALSARFVQLTIAIALPRFNHLRRSKTGIFLLIDHFLCRLSTFSEKMRKMYKLEAFSKIG